MRTYVISNYTTGTRSDSFYRNINVGNMVFTQKIREKEATQKMKIMKVVDKKVGDTIYYKYRINLPKDIIEENKLLGKEFKVKFENGKIIVEKM